MRIMFGSEHCKETVASEIKDVVSRIDDKGRAKKMIVTWRMEVDVDECLASKSEHCRR